MAEGLLPAPCQGPRLLGRRWLLVAMAALTLLTAAPGTRAAEVVAPTKVSILLYHRFGPDVPNTMTVKTADFEGQLKSIKSLGYTVIPLKELLQKFAQMRQMMVQLGASTGLMGKIPGFKQFSQMKKLANMDINALMAGGGGLPPGLEGMAGGMPNMPNMNMANMPNVTMSGQSMGGMAMKADLNDIAYDAFLANDRTLADPQVVDVGRHADVRLRIINGSSSTNFWIAPAGIISNCALGTWILVITAD